MCWNFTYADGDREKEDKVVKKLKLMCLECQKKCGGSGCLECSEWRKVATEMKSLTRMFELLKLLHKLREI